MTPTKGVTAQSRPSPRPRRWLRTLAILAIIAVLAAAGIRALGVQSFSIPSESMQPTFAPGARVTVLRADALTGRIDAGDVVVIDGRGSFLPTSPPNAAQQLGSWFGLGPGDVFFIKRVIAGPGDTLECCSESGALIRNGKELDEPYLAEQPSAEQPASAIPFRIEVPGDRLWLMGDNRADSTDSRSLLGSPGGGMIPTRRVIGVAIGHGSSVDRGE
ncbi:signal peptidase I [Brevibacterium otitidis]|uniref:Signal peptidase I n=1 Tax=Brevibacterium otitidis TaxID=53364 RepID=A0ABV5X4Z5_9MICO|nr:signal peptidase I [Brevibacterium otitidis]